MKKHISTIVLIFVFLVGLSVVLYPAVSDYVNSIHQSRAIISYDESVDKINKRDYSEQISAVHRYNTELFATPAALYEPELLQGYEELLDITGTGIMGYIKINTLNLELPIYHGTSEEVLQIAVGHLQGTSLPAGGESTHCVLSAHRGLPTARLFTDLDRLKKGDIFTLKIYDETLTYQVDQIETVLPHDTTNIEIIEGEDLCTLLTCTPYGVNTERLLVRGRRIENIAEDTSSVIEPVDGNAEHIIPILHIPEYLITFFLVVIVIGVIVFAIDIYEKKRGYHETETE